ncbi:MAG: TrmJ/YjtD family RNA methyltransferase [Proteobacteria bacterium]|nr:TrmJ/YjtD family RNA methyltransferase [Pseudomonadota bacterium]
MPGAGTDKTRRWIEQPGPVVILVEPQMGENIGAAARAMANFGLGRLRLVKPRQGWPNEKAVTMAAGADRILDGARLYETLEEAVADCSFVIATTARHHDQHKPIIDAQQAAAETAPRVAGGETVALVFGRERNGLENHEVGLADRILTLPVNPAFASLNLAQAVIVVAYEWFKLAGSEAVREDAPRSSPPVGKQQLGAFFRDLERELEKVEFFRPAEKRETMTINLRNIFTRMELTQQDIRTLHGVVMSIANGRKGPARGGTLDPAAAEELRGIIADHGAGTVAQERAPVKGLARLLRRNPTEAERTFWTALTNDRRFAGLGFKRQVPLGPHMADLVSIPLRCVIEILSATETGTARDMRPARHEWLKARNYRVITVAADDVEKDVKAVLDDLAPRVTAPTP